MMTGIKRKSDHTSFFVHTNRYLLMNANNCDEFMEHIIIAMSYLVTIFSELNTFENGLFDSGSNPVRIMEKWQ